MPPTSNEKWEIQVGKKMHIVSGEEMKAILSAGEARFVKFRDLVVNPAFVSDMVLISGGINNQIEKPKIEIIDRWGEVII